MPIEYKYEQGQMNLKSSDSKGKTCWYVLIFVVLLAIGAIFWVYFVGYLTPIDAESGNSFSTSLRGKMNEQRHLLVSQKKKIEDLSQKYGVLKRENKIQVVANQELNNKLQLAEKKLSESDEELMLYGNILNAKDLKQGLHIQHFGLKVVRVDKDGKKIKGNYRFRYHVVLSYIRKDSASLKGRFAVSITGKQKNKTVTLKHQDLVPVGGGTALTGFSLKYYQGLEGEVDLPKDFTPETVKLTVSPSSGKALDKSYTWAAIMKNEN